MGTRILHAAGTLGCTRASARTRLYDSVLAYPAAVTLSCLAVLYSSPVWHQVIKQCLCVCVNEMRAVVCTRAQMDVECANWLAECEVPFAVVFTKVCVSAPVALSALRVNTAGVRKEHRALTRCSAAVLSLQLDNRKKDCPSPQQNIRAFKAMLAKDFERLPWCFETSSKSGIGRTELLGYLSSVRQMHDADPV